MTRRRIGKRLLQSRTQPINRLISFTSHDNKDADDEMIFATSTRKRAEEPAVSTLY